MKSWNTGIEALDKIVASDHNAYNANYPSLQQKKGWSYWILLSIGGYFLQVNKFYFLNAIIDFLFKSA